MVARTMRSSESSERSTRNTRTPSCRSPAMRRARTIRSFDKSPALDQRRDFRVGRPGVADAPRAGEAGGRELPDRAIGGAEGAPQKLQDLGQRVIECPACREVGGNVGDERQRRRDRLETGGGETGDGSQAASAMQGIRGREDVRAPRTI